MNQMNSTPMQIVGTTDQIGNTIQMNQMVQGQIAQPITVTRLQDLVREVDPTIQLDEEVEETLLCIADDFIDNVIKGASLIAKHRRVPTIEVRDVQMLLERNYNMWISGFGTDEVKPYKRSTLTEAHKQRLALIRRTLKKY